MATESQLIKAYGNEAYPQVKPFLTPSGWCRRPNILGVDPHQVGFHEEVKWEKGFWIPIVLLEDLND